MDYKRGDRVLVHVRHSDGRWHKRMWRTGSVISVGKGANKGTYRVMHDDGQLDRVPAKAIYGRTPLKRRRKAPIKGRDINRWRPEVDPYKRVKQDRKVRGLTARQMIQGTFRADRINASYVTLKRKEIRRRKERGPDGEEFWTWLTKTRTSAAGPNDRARDHWQRIDILKPDEKSATAAGTRLKVECDCERHKFVWEYALSRYGAADIKHSNGEPARVTNPRNAAGCCKHLLTVLGGSL